MTVTSPDDVTRPRRNFSYLPRLDHSGPIVTVTSPDNVTRPRRNFSYLPRLDHSGPFQKNADNGCVYLEEGRNFTGFLVDYGGFPDGEAKNTDIHVWKMWG